MPRSKSLSHYPSRYGEIIEGCAVRGETVTVPLESTVAGIKLRGPFYAYLGALRRGASLAQARTSAPSRGEAEIIERAAQSERVIVTLRDDDGKPVIVFQNRDEAWQAKALAAATVTKGVEPSNADALDEGAARLLRLQSEGAGGKGKG